MAEAKKTVAPKAAKPAVKKVAARSTSKVQEKKASAKETVATTIAAPKKVSGLKVDVVDITGKVVETVELPEEFFGGKVNSVLMAQAVRVYLANQRLGTATTKTRGEVDGSTRKIYRQKGTGRARHGGVRAPIFVKGGIAHGPKQRDYSLALSKNMKKAALVSALSAKVSAGEVAVIAGLTKVEKTQAAAKALAHTGYSKKAKMLLILPKHDEKLFKAVRNLAGMNVMPVQLLNTYEVLRAKQVVFMKEAVEVMVEEKQNA